MLDFILANYLWLVVVLVAVLLRVWEWRAPDRQVDRRGQLKLDLVGALAAAVVCGLCHAAIEAGLSLASLGSTALAMLPSAAKIALTLLTIDFTLYWMHRAMHASELLWRMHRWHHTPQSLYWLSGIRTSALQLAIEAVPQALIPVALFRLSAGEALVGYALLVFLNFWIHSNVRPPRGILGALLVGPGLHKAHHSVELAYQQANFGTFFTVWDHLFGTYKSTAALPEAFPLGVDANVREADFDARKSARWIIGF